MSIVSRLLLLALLVVGAGASRAPAPQARRAQWVARRSTDTSAVAARPAARTEKGRPARTATAALPSLAATVPAATVVRGAPGNGARRGTTAAPSRAYRSRAPPSPLASQHAS